MINTIKDMGDIVRIVLRLCEFEGIDLEVDENGPVIRFREPDVKRVLANRLDYERMFRQAGKTGFPQVKETATKPTLTMLPKSKHGGMNQ